MAAFSGLKQKFSSFFRHAKPIVGLALSNDALYAVVFSNDEKQSIIKKKISLESFDSDSVERGLKKLKSELSVFFSSAIVSFPPADSYLAVFEFPLSAESGQIEEAMKLAVSSLPLPEMEIYSDWMPLENAMAKKKEAVLGMARKNFIDFYLNIFEKSGVSVVATETYVWSLGQFLEEGDDISMIVVCRYDELIFAIYDGKIPYFQFCLPKDKFENEENFLKAVSHFAKRLIHFVSTENSRTREVKSVFAIGDEKIKNELKKDISENLFKKDFSFKSGDSGWFDDDIEFLFALGAAKRGLIPRRLDTIVSLMPIGTEIAYEQHRLFSFVDFFQKLSVGFAGFLIVLFIGVSIMIKTSASNVEKLLEKETVFSPELSITRDKAKDFNEKVVQMSRIYSSSPVWEKIFPEIDGYSGVGLTISRINAAENGELSFSGTAASRDALLVLKNRLAASVVLEAEPLPLSLFLGKENINFTIKAKLKDVKFLYNAE